MTARKRSVGRHPIVELTDPQRRTLQVLQRLVSRHGKPPTIKELAAAREVSVGTIQDQIAQLERKGYVRRDPHQSRNLTVLRGPTEDVAELIEVPIIGTVAAGPPIWATENILGHVMVEASSIRGRCFALQVQGDSMIRANMKDGDLVIVRQQPVAENGDIVVALLSGEATVKRLSITEEAIRLIPENPKYRPLTIDPSEDFRIVGKVIAIRRAGQRL
jgi:repressor LexA